MSPSKEFLQAVEDFAKELESGPLAKYVVLVNQGFEFEGEGLDKKPLLFIEAILSNPPDKLLDLPKVFRDIPVRYEYQDDPIKLQESQN